MLDFFEVGKKCRMVIRKISKLRAVVLPSVFVRPPGKQYRRGSEGVATVGEFGKYHVSSVIRSFVFLCRKVGSIKGYFL